MEFETQEEAPSTASDVGYDDTTTPADDNEQSYSIADAYGAMNICDLFPDHELDTLGGELMAAVMQDEIDFAPRKARIEELYKLALQTIEKKNYPFEGAANVKYPSLTKAAIGFSALAYPSIVKDDSVVKGKICGNDEGGEELRDPGGNPLVDEESGKALRKNAGVKTQKAARVGKFMSWQVLEDMDGWEDDMDKALLVIPIIGCAFKKIYYDFLDRKNKVDLVLPQYLVFSPGSKTPKTAPRASETVELSKNDIESNIRYGLFRKFEYEKAVAQVVGQQDKPEGQQVSSNDKEAPHQFSEVHCWKDLDKDGYAEPYIIWIHRSTSKIVRILPRFDEDSVEMETLGQDAAGNAITGRILCIRPETFYNKIPFIPDPEGSIYDIGFGHLLQHINEAANTSINQLIDAGHRYVMGGGFFGKGMKMKGGDLRFKPGEYKRVDSSGLSLKDNIVPLPMPEPSLVLFQLMQFLLSSADDIATVTKIMSGDIPANMPATTILASTEQGLQPFKAIYRRVHRSLKREFKRLFALNRKHLAQEEYAAVLDDPDANVEADFDVKSVDVIPVSDPEMVNGMQQLIRAQALAEYRDDPLVDGIEVRRRVFRAMNIADADKLVKIPPPVKDELVEAQKAALMAQIEKMNRDNERADIETALNIEKGMAEIILKSAQATKALADAEAAEQGPQMQIYMKELDQLQQRMTGYSDAARNYGGRNKQLAGAPGDGQVVPVPQ